MEIISKKITLTRLNISYSRLDNENFLISHLINLEHLTLNPLNFYECNLTDDNLLNIINNCKKLKHLNLSSFKNISRFALKKIKNIKTLEELLLNSTKVDDGVVRHYKNLRIFECENCKKITDYGVKKIFKKSPNIERLKLSGCQITSQTIKYASMLTKNSKKKLCLIVDDDIINNFDDINNIKPFLRLEDHYGLHFWE